VIDCGSLEYAQARLQARNSQRPDESVWRRIEVIREFAPMLEAARSSALRPWLVGLTAGSGAHEIESTLRSHWRALVEEVAGWLPGAWQPAVRWCGPVPDLPVLQHLAGGGAPLAWMRSDAAYQDLCDEEPATRAAAVRSGPLAAFAGHWGHPDGLAAAWRTEFRRRIPRGADAGGSELAELARTVSSHLATFGAAQAGDGSPLRRALAARLLLLFRRAILDPAAPFVFLALSALDLERLRGELLRRAAFPRLLIA